MKKRVLYIILVVILVILSLGLTSCIIDLDEDMTPPRVIMIDPSDNSTNVSLMPTITVMFDKAMNFHTINVSLIDLATNRTEPCYIYRDGTDGVTVVPRYELYPWSEYMLIVKEDCSDIYGNWMERSYTSRFRTGNNQSW